LALHNSVIFFQTDRQEHSSTII